jgi:hypothetical protein
MSERLYYQAIGTKAVTPGWQEDVDALRAKLAAVTELAEKVEEQRDALAALFAQCAADARHLQHYVAEMGLLDSAESDCIHDDTCACDCRPVHDAVNRLCKLDEVGPGTYLAARDARMQALGAAEELERLADTTVDGWRPGGELRDMVMVQIHKMPGLDVFSPVHLVISLRARCAQLRQEAAL